MECALPGTAIDAMQCAGLGHSCDPTTTPFARVGYSRYDHVLAAHGGVRGDDGEAGIEGDARGRHGVGGVSVDGGGRRMDNDGDDVGVPCLGVDGMEMEGREDERRRDLDGWMDGWVEKSGARRWWW